MFKIPRQSYTAEFKREAVKNGGSRATPGGSIKAVGGQRAGAEQVASQESQIDPAVSVRVDSTFLPRPRHIPDHAKTSDCAAWVCLPLITWDVDACDRVCQS